MVISKLFSLYKILLSIDVLSITSLLSLMGPVLRSLGGVRTTAIALRFILRATVSRLRSRFGDELSSTEIDLIHGLSRTFYYYLYRSMLYYVFNVNSRSHSVRCFHNDGDVTASWNDKGC